jgi:hypothetical protein
VSTAAERSQIARIAANTRWAMEPDRSAATQAARDGLMARFAREVDPEGRLAPEERARRVESLRKAHFQRLAMKGAKARREAAAARRARRPRMTSPDATAS